MNEKDKSEMNLVKYFCDGLTPDMKLKAKEEIGETEEKIELGLKELKSLIKDEPDFQPLMDDKFLLRFLRGKKYDSVKAFKKLQSHYAYKARYSGIISDFKPSDLKYVLDVGHMCTLEYRTPDYIGIGYARLAEYEHLPLDDLVACAFVCAEVGFEPAASHIFGYSLILDCEGMSLNRVRRFASPTFLYRLILGMQEYVPIRVRSIHIINNPFYSEIVIKLLRTFMSEKIYKRFYSHGSNLESLHKYIPPEILPAELGGKLRPISETIDRYNEKILSYENHFIRMNNFGYKGKTLRQLTKDNPNAIIK